MAVAGRHSRDALGAAVLALGAVLVGACEPKENPILSNERFPGEKYPPNVLYTPEQQRQMVEAMRSTALGMPHDELTSAPDDVRWSDVEQAARLAASAAEMGIVTSSQAGDVWTINLITAGNAPVVFTVERREPPFMYQATAKAGVFGEDGTAAERLVREFRMAMRRLGSLKRPA